jgi:hypothetical protein
MKCIGSVARCFCAGIPLASAIFGSGIARAEIIQIDAFDNGWYDANGLHTSSNQNIFVGKLGTTVYNNWLAFDVAVASGSAITSATVTLFAGNGLYRSFESETYRLHDYGGSIDALLGGTGGVSAFSDLGSGTSYGQATVSAANLAQMPGFSVVLSPAALTAIGAAAGSSDTRFVVGGSLSQLWDFSTLEGLFGDSSFLPAAQLTLELERVAAVPLHPSIVVNLVAAGLLGVLVWRRKRKAAAPQLA